MGGTDKRREKSKWWEGRTEGEGERTGGRDGQIETVGGGERKRV